MTGTVTGLIASVTGVFVIPSVPYLQAIGLEKEELLQALGLSFTISTLAYDKSGPRWCAQRFFFGGLLLLGAYLVIGAFR